MALTPEFPDHPQIITDADNQDYIDNTSDDDNEIGFPLDTGLTENGTVTPPDFPLPSEGIEIGTGSTEDENSISSAISLASAPATALGPGLLQTPNSLPNLTAVQGLPVFSSAMDPTWPSQGTYFNHYQPGALRADRQSISPQASMHPYDEIGHRRAITVPHNSTYLPPVPPLPHPMHGSAGSGNVNLPPLPGLAYGNYPNASSIQPGSQSVPTNLHTLPYNGNYQPHLGVSNTSFSGYHNSLPSPASMPDATLPNGSHRVPPPHSYNESPRIPVYSSPGHQFSPISPTSNLLHGMNPSSGSTSSSSFPSSSSKNPAGLPRPAKRRSTSGSHSGESYAGSAGYMPTSGETEPHELPPNGDSQPWGMPQSEYKALNPRDKKQVRNRIGARRFRAKRKDYVATLESTLKARDEDVAQLNHRLELQRAEINDLRGRLGMPLLEKLNIIRHPDTSGLGLVMNHSLSNGNGESSTSNGIGSSSSIEWGKTKLESLI